jgi:hypothetical protein
MVIDFLVMLKRRVVDRWILTSTQTGTSRAERICLRFAAVLLLLSAVSFDATQAPAMPDGHAKGESAQVPEARDGRHDFDFNIGVWHTHLLRTSDPFLTSSESFIVDGTVTIRRIWGGKAQLEEIEADTPKGHWEGLSLYLYDPQAHQWGSSFINSRMGGLGSPLIGSVHDDRAELFAQDTVNGKTVLVRRAWSDIKPNSRHFEESYSNDGGRTWKAALSGNLSRLEQAKVQDGSAIAEPKHADEITPEQRQFDFDFGTWSTHSKRLVNPLTGSRTWVELDGKTVVRKVWGGRANLAEYDGSGTGGHVTLLALRWFNPTTHEWNLDFATPQIGTLGSPGVGTFKNGRAEFYGFDTVGGRNILIKFSIWKVTDNTAQSEQAFSDDGGKTWEVNWINQYTRADDQ